MPLAKAKITDYFNPTTFSKVIDLIDDNDIIQDNSNEICGNEKTASVKPILKKRLENAERNNQKWSTKRSSS
jgi:hypothetical protein